ncbi:MAG: class I SAM-dependent methyltransferase [bacterium]
MNYLKYRVSEFLYGGKKIKIDNKALVLEVACGGKPYWRSNVLVDRYVHDDAERNAALVIDRDFVVADVFKLPFADKTFDFVIARHILEHLPNVELFIAELERVAKAGYIETPSAESEEIFGWPFHIWKVSKNNEKLFIVGKELRPDSLGERLRLFLEKTNNVKHFFVKYRDLLYVDYYWQDKINFSLENTKYQREISGTEYVVNDIDLEGIRRRYSRNTKIKIFVNKWRRKLFYRGPAIDLNHLLACTDCKAALIDNSDEYVCSNCKKKFKKIKKIPIMIS